MANYPGKLITVLTDKKARIESFTTTGELAYYQLDVISYFDFYPFGMMQPNRHGQENGTNYRYGYQGSEADNDVKGKGNSYATFFRQHDPRLGRWLSPDPKADLMPWESPYAAMNNNPVRFNDPMGDCPPCLVYALFEASAYIGGALIASYAAYELSNIVAEATFTDYHHVPPVVADETGLAPPRTIPPPPIDLEEAQTAVNSLKKELDIPQYNYEDQPDNKPDSKPDYYPLPFNNVDTDTDTDEEQYEYFYRTMSKKEFSKTGGLLKHRKREDGTYKGEGPFITTNSKYLKSSKSFIRDKKHKRKYDIIVEYRVPKGTETYLNTYSLKHPQENITKKGIRWFLPVRKEENKIINYGFPGKSGDVHFNHRIKGMKIEHVTP